jgi:signal transduction histidine kinase
MASRLPEGGTLSPQVFEHRHRLLQVVLALHVPGLAVFALARGVDPLRALAGSVAVPGACLVLSTWARGRRVRALLVTAGLLWCSTALVSFAGGSIEARFHVFVVLAAISLYQDWVPFGFAVAFAILSNGLSGRSAALFGVGTAEQRHPWTWAAVEGAAILGAALAQLVAWKESELERTRSAALARELTHAEDTAEQRRIVANLLVSLARRNQALLERQLDMVDRLEADEQDPVTLSELFRVDHLATRMRRNAESLLVLAGNEPIRRWRDAIPASEVARGASAEIEDYPRVDVVVAGDPTVVGHAVADLAHLLAELLENAAVFSPPDLRVVVRGRSGPEGYELRVEDAGLGMSEADRATWNARFGAPPELDPDVFGTLGLHVVARLAARHAIAVRLEAGVPDGTTVVVVLPPALLAGPFAPGLPDTAAGAEGAVAGGPGVDEIGIAPFFAGQPGGDGPSDGPGRSPAAPDAAPRTGRHWISAPAAEDTAAAGAGPAPGAATSEAGEGESAPVVGEWAPVEGDPAPVEGEATPVVGAWAPVKDGPAPGARAETAAEAARLQAERRFLGPDPRAPAQTGWEPAAAWIDPRHPAGRALRAADGPGVLDQRVPQTHLAEGIAGTPPAPVRREGAEPDPERIRDRLQRFQRGVRDGRRTAEGSSDGPLTGPTDPLEPGPPAREGGGQP